MGFALFAIGAVVLWFMGAAVVCGQVASSHASTFDLCRGYLAGFAGVWLCGTLIARVTLSRLCARYRDQYGSDPPPHADAEEGGQEIGALVAGDPGQLGGGIAEIAIAEARDMWTSRNMSAEQADLFKRIGFARNRIPSVKALVLGALLMWLSLAVVRFLAAVIVTTS